MTEGTLKRVLLLRLRKTLSSYVIFSHSDRVNAGIPDISVNGHGQTSWWEGKVAPGFHIREPQHRFLCKLEKEKCPAFYVIWDIRNWRITVVQPSQVAGWKLLDPLPTATTRIFDHDAVIGFIRAVHEQRKES